MNVHVTNGRIEIPIHELPIYTACEIVAPASGSHRLSPPHHYHWKAGLGRSSPRLARTMTWRGEQCEATVTW
jgi:hypothetical protein